MGIRQFGQYAHDDDNITRQSLPGPHSTIAKQRRLRASTSRRSIRPSTINHQYHHLVAIQPNKQKAPAPVTTSRPPTAWYSPWKHPHHDGEARHSESGLLRAAPGFGASWAGPPRRARRPADPVASCYCCSSRHARVRSRACLGHSKPCVYFASLPWYRGCATAAGRSGHTTASPGAWAWGLPICSAERRQPSRVTQLCGSADDAMRRPSSSCR